MAAEPTYTHDLPRWWVEVLRPGSDPVVVDDGEAAGVEVACSLEPWAGGGVRVTLAATAVEPGPVALRLRAHVPGTSPWWLVPGAFYGENRPVECLRLFPRFTPFGTEPLDDLTSSWWEFRADRCATPGVFAWTSPAAGQPADRGAAILGPDETAWGQCSYGFADLGEGAEIWATVPLREGPMTYVGSAVPEPAGETWFDATAGDRIEVTYVLTGLPGERHSYAPVLAARRAELTPSNPLHPWVDAATAAELAAYGLVRWHFDPDPGVLLEAVAFDRGIGVDGRPADRQAMHVGWVSGIPWAYALLRHGLRTQDSAALDAGRAVIDFCCANLSPSGTFYGTWYRDAGWRGSWSPVPRAAHARTLGEAVLFLQRAIRELTRAGLAVPPAWRHALDSHLAVMARRVGSDGNLGAVHDHDTGEVLSWQGAAGLVWAAVFAEADDPTGDLLAVAERAGDYYASFVRDEFVFGSVEDVDLAPTSEDGYMAVLAYVALARRTRDARWVDLARRAADWTMTFRYSFNVSFDPRTILGVFDLRTRGGDQASPSNQHLHSYGLVCTAEMVELSTLAGDPAYEDLALEHAACFRQFVARSDGDFNAERGMVPERFYTTHCFEAKGKLLGLSHAWCAGAVLLACDEIVMLDTRRGVPKPGPVT